MVEERPIVVARVQGKKSDNTFEDIKTDDAGKLLVWDPKVGSLISYEGTTTADGLPGGTTLVCSDLTTKPDFDGQWVVITSGAYAGQCNDITGPTTGGTVIAHEAFDGQILTGTTFVILAMKALPAEVAAIDAKLGAFTAAENLKAILGDLATTKRLGQILGALDETNTLKAILGAYTAAANLKAAIDTIDTVVDDIHDTDLPAVKTDTAAIKTQTDKIAGKMLFSMDFWSIPQKSVILPAGAATQTLPDVVVAALPNGMTVVKATAMFKFRMLDNAGAANKLNGDQHIGIQKGGAGGFADAISLVDDQFGIAAATREGGDVVVGDHNVVAKVDANATYNFQWTSANADVANLTFFDLQMGLRIWYSV